MVMGGSGNKRKAGKAGARFRDKSVALGSMLKGSSKRRSQGANPGALRSAASALMTVRALKRGAQTALPVATKQPFFPLGEDGNSSTPGPADGTLGGEEVAAVVRAAVRDAMQSAVRGPLAALVREVVREEVRAALAGALRRPSAGKTSTVGSAGSAPDATANGGARTSGSTSAGQRDADVKSASPG